MMLRKKYLYSDKLLSYLHVGLATDEHYTRIWYVQDTLKYEYFIVNKLSRNTRNFQHPCFR